MSTALSRDQQEYLMDNTRQWQAHYDNVLRKVGMSAPAPLLGQHPNDYRREALRTMKRAFLQNHELYRVNMRGLDDPVTLNNIEKLVFEAVPREAYNPANVPRGQLREIKEIDEFGALKVIHHIGQECFVKQMGRPGRRVASFNTPNGPVSASGMFLR
jgi:hypothetical protein